MEQKIAFRWSIHRDPGSDTVQLTQYSDGVPTPTKTYDEENAALLIAVLLSYFPAISRDDLNYTVVPP